VRDLLQSPWRECLDAYLSYVNGEGEEPRALYDWPGTIEQDPHLGQDVMMARGCAEALWRCDPLTAACAAAIAISFRLGQWVGHLGANAEFCHQFRDIVGNPFRPVTFDPSWRTSTAHALAQGIYADRAFDRLPILADALQDAGCENADILTHCRDLQFAHVRGCWVVDLVLGKN
jgi:hypothetical protein